MSEYDSDEIPKAECADSEPEPPALSQTKSTDQQMGINVCPHSANIIQKQPSTKFGLNLPQGQPTTRAIGRVTYRLMRQDLIKRRNF